MEKTKEKRRFFDRPTWWIPANIGLRGRDGDRSLVWREGDGFRKVFGSPSAVLREFARLRLANDEAFLAFARKYGVLGLCTHGRPFTHARPRFGPPHEHGVVTATAGCCKPIGIERLTDWRRLSLKAHLTTTGYKDGKDRRVERMIDTDTWVPDDDEDGEMSDIRDLETSSERSRRIHAIRKNAYEMLGLGTAEEWIRDSGLSLDVECSSSNRRNLSLRPRYSGLFDLLAVQLLLTATQAEDLRTCSECGTIFVRRRRERAGAKMFCLDCGRPAANRAAQRNWRKRHAGKGEQDREEKTHE